MKRIWSVLMTPVETTRSVGVPSVYDSKPPYSSNSWYAPGVPAPSMSSELLAKLNRFYMRALRGAAPLAHGAAAMEGS